MVTLILDKIDFKSEYDQESRGPFLMINGAFPQ